MLVSSRTPDSHEPGPSFGGHTAWTRFSGPVTCSDLVRREFRSDQPNRLWMTAITEHFSREGKVYCRAVLDAHSRRVVGWSIDASQTAAFRAP